MVYTIEKGVKQMEKVKMIFWLSTEMRKQLKEKCKSEGKTMQLKFLELVREYLKKRSEI